MNNPQVEQIAKMCYETNREYCKMLGDNSLPSWEEAQEWQRNTVLNGVRTHLENPNATPEDSHISWLKQKQEEGWVYGPVKDPEKKEHPCCVPYNELPVEQRVKDLLFKTAMHAYYHGMQRGLDIGGYR